MINLFTKVVQRALRLIGVLIAVAAITVMNFRFLHVNSATAALFYLLLILGLATQAGLKESLTASVASMFCYNFYFLPPIGKLIIADPQNWSALCVFVITSVTASQLSASARRKTEEAQARQWELERIHEFSTALMIGDTERRLTSQIPQRVAEVFDLTRVSFYDLGTNAEYTFGSDSEKGSHRQFVRGVAEDGRARTDAAENLTAVPVQLGGHVLGSLAVAADSALSAVALQAIAQTAAIAIERARAQELATRAEATRQHEELKSTLLDALAHEFKTPLTSIKAATTTVLARQRLDPMERELLVVADEETDRLTSLVSESIEVARIGSGQVRLQRVAFSADRLVESALAQLRNVSDGREFQVSVPGDLPELDIDPNLTGLVMRQLISNAVRYAPVWSPVRISAEEQAGVVVFGVANDGPGIPVEEQQAIFEKFYRGREVRTRVPGTGMGLTIGRGIIEAHGGRLWLESAPDKGAKFLFTLPVRRQERAAGAEEKRTA